MGLALSAFSIFESTTRILYTIGHSLQRREDVSVGLQKIHYADVYTTLDLDDVQLKAVNNTLVHARVFSNEKVLHPFVFRIIQGERPNLTLCERLRNVFFVIPQRRPLDFETNVQLLYGNLIV